MRPKRSRRTSEAAARDGGGALGLGARFEERGVGVWKVVWKGRESRVSSPCLTLDSFDKLPHPFIARLHRLSTSALLKHFANQQWHFPNIKTFFSLIWRNWMVFSRLPCLFRGGIYQILLKIRLPRNCPTRLPCLVKQLGIWTGNLRLHWEPDYHQFQESVFNRKKMYILD